LATHREKHVQLLAQMKSSVDNVGINPRGVLKLKAFFFNWLVDHVLNEDRRYYEFEKLHPLS
jgi:hemerythrin